MKPVNFDYERPRTIDEACELLASNSNARILAGGQSLIPMLSMRLSRPVSYTHLTLPTNREV